MVRVADLHCNAEGHLADFFVEPVAADVLPALQGIDFQTQDLQFPCDPFQIQGVELDSLQ